MRLSRLTAFGILFALAPLAAADEYAVGWAQSEWQIEASPQACRLTHTIPDYGTAAFEQGVDSGLAFVLRSRRPLPAVGHAEVSAMPAAWQHDVAPRAVGYAIPAASATLRLEGDGAAATLRELQHGRFAAFRYPDAAARGGHVSVTVVAIGMRQALREFEVCRRGLRAHAAGTAPAPVASAPHAGTAAYTHASLASTVTRHSARGAEVLVSEARVLFAFDSAELDALALAELARVAAYVQSDPRVRVLLLAGHTDNVGTADYNQGLSQRRAAAARERLIALGVPARLIEPRHYGETRPHAPNELATGRAENRRVVISLLRAEQSG